MLRPWEFGRLQPHEFLSMLDGYLWRCRQEKVREDNAILRDAYFTSQLMWVSGRTLKRQIPPFTLAEPLLKARDKTYLKEKRQKRHDDEEYLKKTFNLKGVDS
ncbi:hypothetical protein HMPREF1006_00473 [Synergistes sp. 3_1_syn1]|nr:hypothetical protein HMPREF1006_00473 [Synergistes sp. 3_1_syn1]